MAAIFVDRNDDGTLLVSVYRQNDMEEFIYEASVKNGDILLQEDFGTDYYYRVESDNLVDTINDLIGVDDAEFSDEESENLWNNWLEEVRK